MIHKGDFEKMLGKDPESAQQKEYYLAHLREIINAFQLNIDDEEAKVNALQEQLKIHEDKLRSLVKNRNEHLTEQKRLQAFVITEEQVEPIVDEAEEPLKEPPTIRKIDMSKVNDKDKEAIEKWLASLEQ